MVAIDDWLRKHGKPNRLAARWVAIVIDRDLLAGGNVAQGDELNGLPSGLQLEIRIWFVGVIAQRARAEVDRDFSIPQTFSSWQCRK